MFLFLSVFKMAKLYSLNNTSTLNSPKEKYFLDLFRFETPLTNIWVMSSIFFTLYVIPVFCFS